MEHPITPPPEMVRQWLDNDDFPCVTGTTELLTITKDRLNSVSAQAARWGADQKLEACCDAIYKHEGEPLCGGTAEWLRNAMSPKPPSLKQQAISDLHTLAADLKTHGLGCNTDTILRALEALSDE